MNKKKSLLVKHNKKSYNWWGHEKSKWDRSKSKRDFYKNPEEAPTREKIRKKSYTSFSYAVIKKWVNSKVGQDFDNVYSEFLSKLPEKHKSEYRSLIFYYLVPKEQVIIRDGEIFQLGEGSETLIGRYSADWYVHPETNLICKVKPKKALPYLKLPNYNTQLNVATIKKLLKLGIIKKDNQVNMFILTAKYDADVIDLLFKIYGSYDIKVFEHMLNLFKKKRIIDDVDKCYHYTLSELGKLKGKIDVLQFRIFCEDAEEVSKLGLQYQLDTEIRIADMKN